jgi:hypothetical protein
MEVVNDFMSNFEGKQQSLGWPLLALYSLWVLVKAVRGGGGPARGGDPHKDHV